MNWISKWWNKKVPWYYFWYPDSGSKGGIIIGIICGTIYLTIRSI